MALLDEGKLQGNIENILAIMRKRQACCPFIDAQWMCDNGATVVWVLTNEAGVVTVYDAPGGAVITPAGALTPVDSNGACP